MLVKPDRILILYDWNKIYKIGKGKVANINRIFNMLVYKQKPKSNKDRLLLFYNRDYSGDGYMLNPQGFLRFQSSYTDREIAQYIMLAGHRNYSDYVIDGSKHLDLIKSPISADKIKENRLLTLEGNKIKFLYEEVI